LIESNLNKLWKELPPDIKLVAVSKYYPVEAIERAYKAGQKVFAESRPQDFAAKVQVLPKDIEWHFIGHLQAKQIKYYIDFVSLIHGVDSVEHLEDVERAAEKAGRVVDVLLQVHVAQEETKFGFAPEDLDEPHELAQLVLPHVRIRGLMGMASHTDDEARVREDFRRVKRFFDNLKEKAFKDKTYFDTISMGMSHDYQLAVAEGSTLVRIGSTIFGPRDYSKKQ